MHVSEPGYAVIRSFEGRSLKAYRDEVGVWTIGYGNTNVDKDVLGFEIKSGVVITEAQADALLRAAMVRMYEPAVTKAMGANVTQRAYDAGGGFHYNTGAIGRASWVKSYVASDLAAVHSQIIQWNKAGGNVLAGLTRRRNREWLMISAGDYGPEGRQTVVTDERGKPVGNAAPVVVPAPVQPVALGLQPWHARMDSILGMYEFSGANDNMAILAMADQCGGSIKRDYKHDAIAWCALTVSWCLITTGFLPVGKGSLAAIDMVKLNQRLDGPCVGAIAVKSRTGGNHTFIVRGRTADGRLVGTGGNQANMVCDESFDPAVCTYHWPKGAQLPEKVGLGTLPVLTVRPHTKREFPSLPGYIQNPRPAQEDVHPAVQNANPPPAVDAGTGMLRYGNTGDEVRDAQRLLIAAGYPLKPKGADGIFGHRTQDAVKDFQRRHPQLEATGYIDPATRAALKRDASVKGKLKTTAKTTANTGGSTAVTDTATGGHIPWEVYAFGGVVALAVVAYFIWHYRDEVRAMFTRKTAQ